MIIETFPDDKISTSYVCNQIGGTTNVGDLCSRPNINFWSFNKPFKFNKSAIGQSVEELEIPLLYANGGFNIPAQNDGGFVATVNGIRNNYDTYAWNYAQPTGTSAEPFRLGDFRRYQHSNTPATENWFRMSYDGVGEILTKEVGFGWDVNVFLNGSTKNNSVLMDYIARFNCFNSQINGSTAGFDEFEELMTSQPLPADGSSVMDFGFLLMAEREGSIQGKQHCFYKVSNVSSELQNASFSFRIPETTDSDYSAIDAGTYYVYPAFVTNLKDVNGYAVETGKMAAVSEENSESSWYVFPVPLERTCKLIVNGDTAGDSELENEAWNSISISDLTFVDLTGGNESSTSLNVSQIYCTVSNSNNNKSYGGNFNIQFEGLEPGASQLTSVSGLFDVQPGKTVYVQLYYNDKDENGVRINFLEGAQNGSGTIVKTITSINGTSLDNNSFSLRGTIGNFGVSNEIMDLNGK